MTRVALGVMGAATGEGATMVATGGGGGGAKRIECMRLALVEEKSRNSPN